MADSKLPPEEQELPEDLEGNFRCTRCNKSFRRKAYYMKHVENEVCSEKRFNCHVCGSQFSRKRNLDKHVAAMHGGSGQRVDHVYSCGLCDRFFRSKAEVKEHRDEHMLEKAAGRGSECGFQQIAHAHRKRCELLRLTFPEEVYFLPQAFVYALSRLVDLLKIRQAQLKMFKFSMVLHVEFIKLNEEAQIETTIVTPFRTDSFKVMPMANVAHHVLNGFSQIMSTIEDFTGLGSGWTVNEILYLDVELVQCRSLTGGCGSHKLAFAKRRGVEFTSAGFTKPPIPLTAEEEEEKRFNELNHMWQHEQNCFYLGVAEHFVSGEAHMREFVQHELVCTAPTPVKLEDIAAFEAANTKLDMSINVFYKSDDDQIYPVHVSKNIDARNIIALMLATTDSGQPGESDMHYAYISDVDSLLAPRDAHSKGRKRTGAKLCFNCMNFQFGQYAYKNHVQWCHQNTGQRVVMPEKGARMKMRENKNAPVAFVIYFDMETLNVEPEKARLCGCDDSDLDGMSKDELNCHMLEELFQRPAKKPSRPCTHKTKVLKVQQPFCYSLVLVDRKGKVREERTYAGHDCAKHFVDTVLELEKKYLTDLLKNPKPMVLTEEDKVKIGAAKDCAICGEALGRDRYRDHCHLTGDFMGVVHNKCNLRRKEPPKMLAYSHNMQNFDLACVLREIVRRKHELKKLTAIPLNTQKFKMVQMNSVVFLDSMSFISDSLDRAVNTLVESDHRFPLLKQRTWHNFCSGAEPVADEVEVEHRCRQLLLRKGVYPYKYATSIEKLRATTSLPPKEEFYREIGGQHISDADFSHAQEVWSAFQCKDLLQYTLLYCCLDTVLLGEIMTHMRSMMADEFNVDICDYLSLPMCSKDLMMRVTGATPELIENQEISNIFQSSLRGGHCFVAHRHVDVEQTNKERAANNLPPVSLAYLDANNLVSISHVSYHLTFVLTTIYFSPQVRHRHVPVPHATEGF